METPTRPPAVTRTQSKRPGGKGAARAAPSQMRAFGSAIGGPCRLVAKCVLPLALLVAVGIGVLYVRLLNGPISLQFLAAPISRSIAAELPGINVAIEDALVRLTEGGSFELRMRNVRFLDAQAAPIALAPLAAVGISASALWSGRLAPDKIVLIEPRLLLVYTEDGGLSVSFAKPSSADVGGQGEKVPAQGKSEGNTTPEDEAISALRPVDIARLVADAGQRARSGSDASSYLREIGVRNATVVLDRSGRQTIWTVIEGDIDLEHKKRRSTLTGSLTLASPSGPWGIAFKIEEAEKSQSVALEASVRDLVPRGIAAMLPEIPLLETLDASVSGIARVSLEPDGRVTGANMELELGRGVVRVPGLEERSMPIDGGHLDVRYDAAAKRIDLAPSTLQWSDGRVTMVGTATAATDQTGNSQWTVDLRNTEGQLSAAEFNAPAVKLDEASVKGVFSPRSGVLSVTQAVIRAGGAQVDAVGEIGTALGNRSIRVDGRIGPATAAVAKAVWPRFLGPGARRWVGRQVTKGRLLGGTFKVAMSGRASETFSAREAERISLSLEIADAAFIPAKTLAPIELPRALVRIEGESLEISIPDASTQVVAGRRLNLKTGRLTAVDIYGDRTPGEIAFRIQGPLAAAVDYLEQESLNIGSLGLPNDGLDGKVEGQFKISLPLVSGVELSDLKIEGKSKVADGRAKQVIGPHDIQGATISIDVGDGAVNATGQMLLGGVTSKLSFQRIFGAPEDKQPPLRLTSNLDAADRAQLGLDINSVVQGDVPVELTMTRGLRNEQQIKVRADLSGAELNIEPLSWRKAPGRHATLQFEVAKGERQKTLLQGFKVVGDDIAIDGSMALDAKGKLVEFQFPDFALTLVSRLDVQGALRSDNVWDVKVHGQYWDGRDFFRSLFSIGQAPEKLGAAKKDQAGLDLKADIDNILGHSDVSLKGLRLQMSRRGGRLSGLIARGNISGGKPIEIGMQAVSNEPRKLVVLTDDAGQAFRLIGFYPNLQGGQMRLDVNLDGKGPAEKTGLLIVERFRILGDPIVSEVLQTSGDGQPAAESGRRPTRRVERQTTDFDWMRAPFSVGYNQFVLEDAELRGPLLGASLRGKADFKAQGVDIGGTYVPLQGLNAAVGGIPLFGQLLAGPKGEGVLGITFRIVGPMAQPQVIVNPLSMIAPGIFREMFQMTTQNPRVIPRDEKPTAAPTKQRVLPAPAGGEPVRSAPTKRSPTITPEVSGGWSTSVDERKK